MILQVGVKAFIKNKDAKFLLLERNLEKYQDMNRSNRWDIVGGRIDAESSLIDNLRREIFEETKLNLDISVTPKLIAAQDIMKADKHVVRLTYIAEANGDVILDDEHIGYQWLTLEELNQLEDLDSYAKELLSQLEL